MKLESKPLTVAIAHRIKIRLPGRNGAVAAYDICLILPENWTDALTEPVAYRIVALRTAEVWICWK